MIQEHKVCTECFDYARDDDVTDYRDRLIKGTGFYSYRRHYYDRHDDLDDIVRSALAWERSQLG